MAADRARGEEAHAYVVNGGNPIQGEIVPGGNKNAALPLLASTLLTAEPVRLDNLPAIRDVQVMLDLVGRLGCTVQALGPRSFELCAGGPLAEAPDPGLTRQIRASFLLAGPLLARCGRAVMPRPGGDRIGRRPLDPHIAALRELGARVEVRPDSFVMTAPDGLTGADIFLPEMSVMATENAIMAAALARGATTLSNAASEPHVQELCHAVNAMGGRVEGVGTNTLRINGRDRLGGAAVTIGPDHVEVGSLIGLAAATGGELLIRGARPAEHHRMTRIAFARLGIEWE
jgi:UDP-N-acetylglucosamine 1-carboxyvinyltransferase